MTDYPAIVAPQLVSGAPDSEREAADKAAQAEALRQVKAEIPFAFGPSEEWARFQVREIVDQIAHRLGVEL
jgi:hypothetical protein